VGLLYEIITKDPEFLTRLRKYLRRRGANNRTYFYFLATLKNVTNKQEGMSVLKWLAKEGLINLEVFQEGGERDDNRKVP